MKTFAFVILTLICVFAYADPASEPLGPSAKRAIAEGKDVRLNAGFAHALGLKADHVLLLKRLEIQKEGATNMLNVVKDDRNTIILSERRGALSSFYLTDPSGKLRKAIVNDGTVSNGGLTNIPLAAAAASFEKQKLLWLNSEPR